ncbi:MAG TPA: ribonuclease HII [Acidimicrobiales bacterium]|nr:ribonuclease HII [Acidimicrobiales bacterium]
MTSAAGIAAAPPVARRPTLEVERRLWREGYRWVAGVDEVGRGAWAGPLSVGVAVVHAGVRTRSIPSWLRDSKLLPEERREVVFYDVARWCADAAVGHATPEECDRYGMTRAWRLAAHRALASLEITPDALVIDGPFDFLRGRGTQGPAEVVDLGEEAGRSQATVLETVLGTRLVEQGRFDIVLDPKDAEEETSEFPQELSVPAPPVPSRVLTMVGADARCAAVSAASVLAKVVRDRMMREEAVHFPPYGFERNKGYPSPRHRIALRGYGLSAIHRRSWAFVGDLPWHS